MEGSENMEDNPGPAPRSKLPYLPLELIYHIVIFTLPPDPRMLVPCSHHTTKTLLSLSRTSRALHDTATKYLRQHCAYIDSDDRLRRLLICIDEQRLPRAAGPTTTTTFLCPLRTLTALHLSPFPRRSLDDQPTALWTRALLCEAAPTLRRLVLDLPLRSLPPAADHLSVRRFLREGLAALAQLEECVSVRDELDLVDDGDSSPVWTRWPRLQRLALHGVRADGPFWRHVAGLPQLENVVLVRAEGLEDTCARAECRGRSRDARRLKLVLVNVESSQPQLAGQESWLSRDRDEIMSVVAYDVPTSYYGDDDETLLCQNWVKASALRGDLWDWQGYQLRPRAN